MNKDTQDDIFLSQAGDDYFDRNFSTEWELGRMDSDKIVAIQKQINLDTPEKILEIGCMSGFRLQVLHDRYDCAVYGIDPSEKAISYGKEQYPDVQLSVGIGSELPYEDNFFDCVILGHYLYWADRSSIFKTAYQLDRVLQDNGIVYIFDFDPVFPHKNTYKHHGDCFTYKMQHYKMLTWNPVYSVIFKTYCHDSDYKFRKNRNDCTMVTVIRKDVIGAFSITDPFIEN